MKRHRYMDMARNWAGKLIHWETQKVGHTKDAIVAVAQKCGIPHGTIWCLRYREPKDMVCSAFFALRDAYFAEMKRRAHRRDVLRARKEAEDTFLAPESIIRRQHVEV